MKYDIKFANKPDNTKSDLLDFNKLNEVDRLR